MQDRGLCHYSFQTPELSAGTPDRSTLFHRLSHTFLKNLELARAAATLHRRTETKGDTSRQSIRRDQILCDFIPWENGTLEPVRMS